ncbi:MAG: hypothetical protein HWE33_12685 [Rhodobacteraceae bacterium]|nr:hypothetical protein [Paracoccaceae bacterium]
MTKRVTRRLAHACVPIAALFMSFSTAPALAETSMNSSDDNTLIIHTDLGGSVRQRYEEISTLIANDTRVEIRDGFCFSSCTMYIGLKNTCVTSKARFGFHGPRSFFGPLSQDRFEEWSLFIAQFYPDPVRDWYLEIGRTTIYGFYKVSGADLIQLGVKDCDA